MEKSWCLDSLVIWSRKTQPSALYHAPPPAPLPLPQAYIQALGEGEQGAPVAARDAGVG